MAAPRYATLYDRIKRTDPELYQTITPLFGQELPRPEPMPTMPEPVKPIEPVTQPQMAQRAIPSNMGFGALYRMSVDLMNRLNRPQRRGPSAVTGIRG